MERVPSGTAPEAVRPDSPETRERALYERLSAAIVHERDTYRPEELGENMLAVNMLIIDHWKPRFLLNRTTQRACEIMNAQAHWTNVSDADIDWSSLAGIPEEYLYRIQVRNALFPSCIYRFERGVAQVRWQINPDGRYWMDEDGYGMTPDEAFDIYGYIDTACRVVVPFRAIENSGQLKEMRLRAEKIVAARD